MKPAIKWQQRDTVPLPTVAVPAYLLFESINDRACRATVANDPSIRSQTVRRQRRETSVGNAPIANLSRHDSGKKVAEKLRQTCEQQEQQTREPRPKQRRNAHRVSERARAHAHAHAHNGTT